MTTENLRNTMATVDAMNSANKEMRKTYGKIDLDKIERVQDDMEDLIEQANEVQSTLGRSYGVPDEIDEEELQAELDALYVRGLNGYHRHTWLTRTLSQWRWLGRRTERDALLSDRRRERTAGRQQRATESAGRAGSGTHLWPTYPSR